MKLSNTFTTAIQNSFPIGEHTNMGQVESVKIDNGLAITVKFFDSKFEYGFMYDIISGHFLQTF